MSKIAEPYVYIFKSSNVDWPDDHGALVEALTTKMRSLRQTFLLNVCPDSLSAVAHDLGFNGSPGYNPCRRKLSRDKSITYWRACYLDDLVHGFTYNDIDYVFTYKGN